MSLASLSSDALHHVCSYLNITSLAQLYATNDRLMMRKLVAPGVYPTLFAQGRSAAITRFILAQTSAKGVEFLMKNSLWDANKAFEFARDRSVSIGGVHLHPRLLLALPRSLTELELLAMPLRDPTVQTTETFASLFPELRKLAVWDLSPATVPVHVMIDQLRQNLPPKLETLALQASALVRGLETLPRSITALHITHPLAIVTLGEYPAEQPTFHLIQQLDKHLPHLATLSVQLASLSRRPPDLPIAAKLVPAPQKLVPLLPNLHTLNIQAELPNSKEYQNIMLSLPSVEILTLACTHFEFSEDDVAGEPIAAVTATPAMPAFGGGGGFGAPAAFNGFGFRGGIGGRTASDDTVKSILPPKLVSLVLNSSQAQGTFILSRRLMSSLPGTLESLTVDSCAMPWARAGTSDGWEPSKFQEPSLQLAKSPFNANENAESWLSLLPPGLLDLRICEVPLQVLHLPPNLRSLQVNRASNSAYMTAADLSEIEAGKPGYKSGLVWPKGLTSLNLAHCRMSIADAISLPPSLKKLDITATQTWDQRHVANLLNALPNCILRIHNTYVWIVDTPTSHTSDATSDLQSKAVSADGTLNLSKLLEHRLRDVPHRVRAHWHPSSPEPAKEPVEGEEVVYNGARVPDVVPRFTIPPGLDFTAVDFPSSVETFWHSRGVFDFSVGGYAAILNHLEESKVVAVREPIPPIRPFSFNATPAPIMHFKNLISLILPTIHALPHITFEQLPRTLVELVLGAIPGMRSLTDVPETFFDSWRSKYGIVVTVKTEKASGGFKFGFVTEEETPEVRRQRKVSDLPRGLVRLSIKSWSLDPECDGEWPSGLVELGFLSHYWTDVAVLNVAKRLPHLKEMTVHGPVVSFGTMPLEDAPSTNSMDCDDDSFKPVTSLDCIDVSALNDVLYAPFKAHNITLQEIILPSLVAMASPSTHTIKLDSAPFVVDHVEMLQNEYSEDTPTGLPRSSGFAFPSTEEFNVSFKEFMTISSLSQYRSLTRFESNIFHNLTWEHVPQLPETLKHLSICIKDSIVVDPFIRLPRFLETLQLACSHAVILTSTGLAQIPPNLTKLECNRLTFSPALIAEFPRHVSSVLFDGCDLWNDLDVYELKRHLGADLISLDIAHCNISGALMPLGESTEISMLTCHGLTKERLGPKVKVTWQTTITPLRFCALDIALQSSGGIHSSILSLDQLPLSKVDHIQTLDLHLAPLQNIRATLPPSIMPSNLTSLSIRIGAVARTADAASLPRTLKYFKTQLYSAFINIDASTWALLPRGLETIIIEFLGFENGNSFAEHLGKVPHTVIEPGLVEYSSVRNPQIGRPSRNVVPWISALDGLPPSLHTLSLRPYALAASVGKDLHGNLRQLCCFDFELRKDEKFVQAHPDLKIIATDPGASALYQPEDTDTPEKWLKDPSVTSNAFDYEARDRHAARADKYKRHFNGPAFQFPV